MSVTVPMNSVQLVQRLARQMIVIDAFNLSSDVALDILSAINGGLALFYRNAPPVDKRTTLSHTVRAPRDVSLTFQAQYSRLVADDSFVVRDQGCTVRFGNASADNIVTGPNSLLDNYLRDDLTTAATIYSDAVPVQDVIERIVGHVRLYADSQASPSCLVRDERLRGGRAYRMQRDIDSGEDYYSLANLNTVGRPQFYYLDPMGVSQGAEPEFVLRLAPFPDVNYTIRMEAELSTQRLIFADLSTPREIYVPSNCLDDILIPLCEGELVSSPFFRDKTNIKLFTDRQAEAIAKMKSLRTDVGPTRNQVGTPPGF